MSKKKISLHFRGSNTEVRIDPSINKDMQLQILQSLSEDRDVDPNDITNALHKILSEDDIAQIKKEHDGK
mgnify:CR=1 FL=1